MAVTSIMTTEGEIKSKVGANVSVNVTDQMYDDWVLQSESFVNVFIRVNYSDTYAGLNVDVKYIFSDIVSSDVAILAIDYDMSGYTSRAEAENMITVLRDRNQMRLAILRDKKYTDFINSQS